MTIINRKNAATKPKCPQLLEAIKNSRKWLFSDTYVVQADELGTLDNAISVLEYHLTDCGCLSFTKVNTFLGICFLQKFNHNSLNFMDNAESLQLKVKSEQTKKAAQDEKKNQPINDVPKDYNRKSKFQWNSDKSASILNFQTLILPALKALEHFCLSYQKGDSVDVISLEQIHFFPHLNSLFQIFYFYNMLQECHRIVDLSIALSDSFPQKILITKMNEMYKTIPSNAIKLYLRLGALSTVEALFAKYLPKGLIDEMPLNSHQNCELFLLYVEFNIRLRTAFKLLPRFKQFMKSEYIEKRTVRRYICKCYALIMATKLSSTHYSFSPVFDEFSDSYTMSAELLKKFSRSERFNYPVEKWDPLSLRYNCFNLFTDASRLAIDFYVNAGMYADAAHYYNSACNFFHRTLNIFELSNLQLKISQIDLSNGFIKDSYSKLHTIELCFVAREQSKDMFHPCNAVAQVENDSLEDDLLEKLDGMTLEDKARNTFHEIRKAHAENIDEFFGKERSVIDLINKNMEMFILGRMFQDLFFFVLRYTYHSIMLQAKQKHTHNVCLHENLSHLLDLLEVYTRKQYLNNIFAHKPLSSFDKIIVKFEYQMNNFQIGETFFLFAIEYSQTLINEKKYTKAFNFLNKAVIISTNDYCLRIQRCELFYLHAYAGYKLAKPLYPDSARILTLCYDDERRAFSIPKASSEGFNSPITNRKTYKPRTCKKDACPPPMPKKQDRLLTQQAEAEIFRHTIPKLSLNISDPIENYDKKKTLQESFDSTDDGDDWEDLSEESDDLIKKCLFDYNRLTRFCSDDCSFITNLKKSEPIILEEIFEKVLRLLTSKLLNYVGSHPPMILFEKCHFLSFKIAKMVGKSNANLLFHLSHVTRSVSLRYRKLLFSAKKRKHQVDVEEDIQQYKFVSSDYSPDAYWSSLPTNWRFVQLIYVEHSRQPYLLVVRFQSKRSPLFIKIKSKLQPQSFFDNIIKEFDDIMTGNSLSFAEIVPKSFWEMRFTLDNRLGDLLVSFERIVTVVFKALFLGVLECQKYQTARQYFITRLRQQAQLFEIKNFDLNLLELFTDSVLLLSKDEFAEGIQIVFGDCDKKFLTVCSQYYDKAFGHWSSSGALESLFKEVNPVGLILCNELMNFPVESCPTGKKMRQPYFRIPSLKFAVSMYESFKNNLNNVPQRNVYYLLNPQNNLGKTEDLFKERFREVSGWKGVIGKEPNFDELKEHLVTDDIYIYVGHGSGQGYYNQVGLETFKINSVALVFGCSSARSIGSGKSAEMYGVHYKFIMNGSPSYLGALWDITDKDIDAFTNDFLSGWLLNYDSNKKDKCPLMNRQISTSRDVCKLKHLIGGAPVIYGLPLSTTITDS